MEKTQWRIEVEGGTEFVEAEGTQRTDTLSFFNTVDGEREIVAEFNSWSRCLRLNDSEEVVVVRRGDLKPWVIDVIKQDLVADSELVELLCEAINRAKERGVDL